MPRANWMLADNINDYVEQYGFKQNDFLQELSDKTGELAAKQLQSAPQAAALLALLVKLINAKRVIEVGAFTGFATLAMAQALPADGEVITCDVDDTHLAVGKPVWQEAGVADKIQVKIAPADKTLQNLLNEGLAGQMDLIFIDANKNAYQTYYELALQLIRPNGLIVLDNMFLHGATLGQPQKSDHQSLGAALHCVNQFIAQDSRVEFVLLPLFDGLSLVRKV